MSNDPFVAYSGQSDNYAGNTLFGPATPIKRQTIGEVTHMADGTPISPQGKIMRLKGQLALWEEKRFEAEQNIARLEAEIAELQPPPEKLSGEELAEGTSAEEAPAEEAVEKPPAKKAGDEKSEDAPA